MGIRNITPRIDEMSKRIMDGETYRQAYINDVMEQLEEELTPFFENAGEQSHSREEEEDYS